MAIVRVLLFLALGMIGVALLLYAVKRDPRYLTFVKQVGKYTLLLLAAVLLYFAAERMFMPVPGPKG